MSRPASLVLAVVVFDSQQAMVLDVVGTGQLPPGKNVMDRKKEYQWPTEGNDEPDLYDSSQGQGLKNLVVSVP